MALKCETALNFAWPSSARATKKSAGHKKVLLVTPAGYHSNCTWRTYKVSPLPGSSAKCGRLTAIIIDIWFCLHSNIKTQPSARLWVK